MAVFIQNLIAAQTDTELDQALDGFISDLIVKKNSTQSKIQLAKKKYIPADVLTKFVHRELRVLPEQMNIDAYLDDLLVKLFISREESIKIIQNSSTPNNEEDMQNKLGIIGSLYQQLLLQKCLKEMEINDSQYKALYAAYVADPCGDTSDVKQYRDCRKKVTDIESKIQDHYECNQHYVAILDVLSEKLKEGMYIIQHKINELEKHPEKNQVKIDLLKDATGLSHSEQPYSIAKFKTNIAAKRAKAKVQALTSKDMEEVSIKFYQTVERAVIAPLKQYDEERGFLKTIKEWFIDAFKQVCGAELSTKGTLTSVIGSVSTLFGEPKNEAKNQDKNHIEESAEVEMKQYKY